jgi:hypothetical protein
MGEKKGGTRAIKKGEEEEESREKKILSFLSSFLKTRVMLSTSTVAFGRFFLPLFHSDIPSSFPDQGSASRPPLRPAERRKTGEGGKQRAR